MLRAASFALLAVAACTGVPPAPTVHAFRLLPGADLREGIQREVDRLGIEAGWVATCVGSLTDYSLRFADQQYAATGRGHFEIVAMTGTVSKHGSHLHLAVSDEQGRTVGGHLVAGCCVYTTAEIVLGLAPDLAFTRAVDGSTPWAELQIVRRR